MQFVASVIEVMPDATIVVDASGMIVVANGQAHTMFGYASGELNGCALASLVPADRRDAHARHVRGYEAAPSRRTMRPVGTAGAVRKDGTMFPVEISLGKVESSQGPVTLASVRDLTKRLHAEHLAWMNEQRLASLTRLAQIGWWELDLRDGPRVYSEALLHVLGMDEPHADATSLYGALHEEDRAHVGLSTLRAIREGIPFDLIAPRPQPDPSLTSDPVSDLLSTSGGDRHVGALQPRPSGADRRGHEAAQHDLRVRR